MSRRRVGGVLMSAADAALVMAGCGGSTPTPSNAGVPAGGASASPSGTATTPTAAPTAAAVSLTCPTAAALGALLGGRSLPAPVSTPTTGSVPGRTGVSCTYVGSAGSAVILAIGTGTTPDPDFFAGTEAAMQAAARSHGAGVTLIPVSGVGTQATIYSFAVERFTESGIAAESGNAGMFITCIPAATRAQLGAVASQVLGLG
jgi:hypothetical protein